MQCRLRIFSTNGVREIEFSPPRVLGELIYSCDGFFMPCGGRGICGKCRVRVLGAVEPAGLKELEAIGKDGIDGGIRLACMTVLKGDADAYLPDRGNPIALTEFDAEAGPGIYRPYSGIGACVDLGTTTVAAYLYDMGSGAMLTSGSAVNPQSVFGADVVSRMQKALEGRGEEISASAADCIKGLIGGLAKKISAKPEDIRRMVVVGNTAMLYLLCGLNPEKIATAPFEAEELFGRRVDGGFLGLPEESECLFMRCASAYVGADAVAAILASNIANKDKPCAMLDLGTNGEMALSAHGRIICCSAAAGPAFEGAGLYMGAPARDGSVDRVAYADGRIEVHVIGGVEATGICGSGIIDAVAAMLDAGIIDETGLIMECGHAFEDWIEEVREELAFRIPYTGIVITQSDVRSVQLAKSAVCAGLRLIADRMGLAEEQIEEIVLAGGFGNFVFPASAKRIGLFPEGVKNARVRQMGNAAASGAGLALIDPEFWEESERLARSVELVELSLDAEFAKYFLDSIPFPGVQ